MTFYLCLSFVNDSLKEIAILECQPIRAPDQILGRLHIISMSFLNLSLRHRVLSHEMSPAVRSKQIWLYSWVITLFPTFLFFTTMLSVALLPHSLETVLVMALFYNLLSLSQLRYYMHGVCREGENCQYSHDLKDKPSMVGS